MFNPIYEIRVCGRNVKINQTTWDSIRDHARSHKFFYIILNKEKYKYVSDQTFFDRPTRFNFEKLDPEEEGYIAYIYVNELK